MKNTEKDNETVDGHEMYQFEQISWYNLLWRRFEQRKVQIFLLFDPKSILLSKYSLLIRLAFKNNPNFLEKFWNLFPYMFQMRYVIWESN